LIHANLLLPVVTWWLWSVHSAGVPSARFSGASYADDQDAEESKEQELFHGAVVL